MDQTLLIDIAVFAVIWALAQWAFNGFEAHLSAARRCAKLVLVAVALGIAYYIGGRPAYYGVIAAMSVGIAVLHGYWFHYRHGIHWRKAEPRDKYLDLIKRSH